MFLGSLPTAELLFYLSTIEAVITGELPAGKDYYVEVLGGHIYADRLYYDAKISAFRSIVPEPEIYAIFLAGLGLNKQRPGMPYARFRRVRLRRGQVSSRPHSILALNWPLVMPTHWARLLERLGHSPLKSSCIQSGWEESI